MDVRTGGALSFSQVRRTIREAEASATAARAELVTYRKTIRRALELLALDPQGHKHPASRAASILKRVLRD